MSKKKKKTTTKPTKEGGLKHFLASPQFAVARGSFYVLFAIYAVVAMASYILSFVDTGREPLSSTNICGTFGGWVASILVSGSFGVASVGLCFLLAVYGLRLVSKYRTNKPEKAPRRTLWNDDILFRKTLWSTLFWVLWFCVTIGWISNPDQADQNTIGSALAGVVGTEAARLLLGLLHIGLPILLLFLACLFLVLVHHVNIKMPELKMLENRKIDRAVAVNDETNNDNEDESEEKKSGFFARLFHREKEDENDDEEVDEDETDNDAADFESDSELDNMMIEGMRKRREKRQEKKQEINEVDTDPSDASSDQLVFNIDDEFERINRRAGRAGEAAEPKFIMNANHMIEDSENSQDTTVHAEAEMSEDADFEPDDYREHYGIDEPYDPKLDLKDYRMPDTSILEDWEQKNVKVTKEELIANKDRIVQTLRDYGIEITEISAMPGPTVTLYKIRPARGVRISKIQGLENDIALSLAALGIRIIAPIPGESNIGIEVPNAKPQIVAMKTMLESDEFRNAKMELPVAFGKTISNECFVTDLAKMPHLLMAGATGTGKSVGLNAVLASLLYTKHPSELKLVLIDPKKVEFSLYSKIERHYLAVMPDELTKDPDKREPVITDVKKVVRTLNSLCIEMDTRYDLLKAAKVRKITEYNEKFCKRMLNPDHGHRYLPYIVVVIDEFGDLIMTVGKEVELPICRLAQLARAVGIHLIIATQRPTTNIITGTIKANFPARVAFRVTSGIDSKTILDTGGAQQLIGRGDMLISLAGKDLLRLQCALIDTPEIERLVNVIGEQRGYAEGEGFVLPEYLDENDAPNKEFDAKAKDEFFNDAARLVVASQFGSTSLLQRKLQLGYNRAGRIIDQLEAAGVVGPYNGSKARDVLIKDEVALEELLRSL
ncbi:MAG: DNA translocase FtsK [Bacteroidales bacterium]|nr:DNA translocase FtsK [Bacteroidales bacterium]